MFIFRVFFCIQVIVIYGGACSVLWGENNEKSSLELAIDKAVSLEPEVVAWEKALEDAKKGAAIREVLRAPELRLKAEEDKLDDALRLGTALRWKLDGEYSKRFLAKERGLEVRVIEYELQRVRNSLRASILNDCLMFSFLKSEAENLSKRLVFENERKARGEAVGVSSLTVLKNRAELIELEDRADRIQDDIQVLERKLKRLGLAQSLLDSCDFDSSWTIGIGDDFADESFLVRLIERHPEVEIFSLRRELLLDELKEKRRKSGFNLSYIQVEYEEENDRDKDEREASVGVSVGVNLPFWNKGSSLQNTKDNSVTEANLYSDLQKTRREVRLAFEEFSSMSFRGNERARELREVIADLESLKKDMNTTEFNDAKHEDLEVSIEALRLEMSLNELKFDSIAAAVELQRVSFFNCVSIQ